MTMAKPAQPEAAAAPAGPPFPLEVRAAWDETPTLRGLRLGGPWELGQQYQAPGQYLELWHKEAGSGYFALAAAPIVEASPDGGAELELLVRRGPGLAGALATLRPDGEMAGSPLHTHGVRGRGFALPPQQGQDLLLVAAGSGIAPLRAVLQLLQQQRQRDRYGRVALYYGERAAADFAYRRELLTLRETAVSVELVLTRPPAGWPGGVGYVQSHLRAAPPPWLGPGTVALLCGQSAMVSEATATLTSHHVPTSQILLNY